jgi:DNA repair protein RadD
MDGSLPPVTLRPYQETAVADIRAAMRQHRRVLFCLPTGGGKTVIFSWLTGEISRKEKRVIIVAHRIEIVRQISKALTRQGIEHGMIVSGLPGSAHPVKVAMVQTLVNRVSGVREPDLLICDEAHHSVAGSWDTIKQAWPHAFHLGVTATPQRLDGKGLGHAFDTLVLGPNPKELIELGNLADYEYLAPPNDLDLSEVHTRAGDYAVDELKEAVEKSTILGDAVIHYRRYLDGKPALVFCINVAHAHDVAARFLAAGIPAAAVDGKMKQRDRDNILSGLEEGRIKVVCSCDLISEGFDVPEVAGCLLLRPTQSLTLFLQQVGRALRPKRDGSKAVILDHVGNYEIHGFPDDVRSWSLDGRPKQSRDTAPSVTACKLCFRVMHAPVIHSPDFPCGGRDDEVCPYREVSPSREIEEVDGDLVDVKTLRDAGPALSQPAWAEGLILENAKGKDWFRLLDLAGTDPERLRQIAKARHYKKGWVGYQMAARHEMEVAAGEVIETGRASGKSAKYTDYERLIWTISDKDENALWLVYRTLKAAIAAGVAVHGDRSTLSYVHNELARRKQAA